MMPIAMRRKTRGMEKVENLYRTARAQNDSINTPEQIRSRFRDSVEPEIAAAAKRETPDRGRGCGKIVVAPV
jgi:hypothetical protein